MENEEPKAQDKKQLLSSLPPVQHQQLRSQIKAKVPSSPILIVLDDDPTGTQTCHDILVLTKWDLRTLRETLDHSLTKQTRGFFILTNSRALHPPEATDLITEICTNVKEALGSTPFELVLRSDSTLRGHFPLEPDAAESVLGKADVWLLAPFFLQGGRYTINDVHYVADGDTLNPAGHTPFAKDASFGYRSSNLPDWIVEKGRGAIDPARVQSLSIRDIRDGGPDKIRDLLLSFGKGSIVVVNAAAEEDMDVVVLGLLEAAAQGRKFFHRSGAALVSSRLGIPPIPPKSAADLHLSPDIGGLVIAGSYVPKTTAQLAQLRTRSGDRLTTITLDVNELLASQNSSDVVVRHSLDRAEHELRAARDVLVMTSRDLVSGRNERESLDIGGVVARALVRFAEGLAVRPRYVIAKGGITSSDVAGKALRMRSATVVGQAAAGIPLWRCEEESSKWPGIPFIVFPGNVGGEDTLFEVVDGWRAV